VSESQQRSFHGKAVEVERVISLDSDPEMDRIDVKVNVAAGCRVDIYSCGH
jgi:hypothetical protein